MKYVRNGEHIVVRLHPGDDVHDSLTMLVRHEEIKGAAIVCGVGMLRNFTLSFFTGKGYSSRTFERAHELVSMQGTIAFAEEGGDEGGALKIHIHASLAGPEHAVVGGHLDSGEVAVLNEIVLLCPKGLKLKRRKNPGTGLFELEL